MKSGIIWLILAVGLCFVPLDGSIQMATNPKAERELLLDGPVPAPKVTAAHSESVNIIVDAMGSPYPTQSLGLLLGTYGRRRHCELTLRVEPDFVSQPVDCRKLDNNAWALFRFGATIPDGIHRATLTSTAQDDANGISFYAYESEKDHQRYATPIRAVEGRFLFSAFWRWAEASPGLAAGYALICLLVLGAAVRLRRKAVLVAAFGLFAGHVLVAPPLSGHDETAHISMLFHAADYQAPRDNGNFFGDANRLMWSANFYRANGVMDQGVEVCPHKILHDCGESAGPLWLYGFYAKVILGLGVDMHPPLNLVWAGRVINLMLVGLTLLLIRLLYGSALFDAQVIAVSVFGCVLAQVASITNDIPMFCIGLLAASALYAAVMQPLNKRQVIGWLLLPCLVAIGRHIDISWLASLLPVALVYAGLVLRVAHGKDGANDARRLGLARALGLTIAASLAVHVALRFGVRLAADQLPDSLGLPVMLLRSIEPAAIKTVLLRGVMNFKSLFGSYVWGHSEFPLPTAIVLGGAAVLAAAIGAKTLANAGRSGKVLLGGYAVVAAVHLILLDAVGNHMARPGVWAVAAAKERFFAPDFGVIILLPVVGVMACLREQGRERGAVENGAIAWVLVMLLHFFPRFLLADFQ